MTALANDFTKLLATAGSRRGLLRTMGALGLGGGMQDAATAKVAARPKIAGGVCGPVSCPANYTLVCTTENGLCIGCECQGPHPRRGIGGGGSARADDGREVNFSLLATRKPDPDSSDSFAACGHVTWTDPAETYGGLAFESLAVTAYGPTEGVEGGRDVAGWLRTDAVETPVPFFLQAVDAGSAGAGKDAVSLLVGDAVPAARLPADVASSGYSYTFHGVLTSGDLTLLSLPNDQGESLPATPIA